jgi:hypothetical protein
MKQTTLEKFKIFYQTVKQLAPLYRDSSAPQKQFLETTVGAAIFYLPTIKAEHFTGQISEEAKRTGEHVQEHLYPRKWVAQQLLLNPPESEAECIWDMNSKYLTYNLTTKAENRRLVPHQKVDVFVSPTRSYELANITLTDM